MLRWTGTALAAGVMLAVGGAVGADDTVRLGGPSAQSGIEGGTDTELVRGYYGGGGYRGGYRGGFYGGGYRGGFYGGGYRGGFYGARYYTPYFSAGFYSRPYYGYSNYSFYYSPYSYASYYYYPCAGETAPAVTLQAQVPQFAPSYYAPAPQQQQSVPMMPPANSQFQYDGGPNQPVPMPGADMNPAKAPPRGIIPLDGKLVSLPSQITGGFSPVTLATPRINPSNQTPRVTYPAYGEQR